jgi:methyltransferase (TIGR00027 family)
MSRTAGGAAFCRLVEQDQPPQLRQFVDPVVGQLLDPMLAVMAAGPVRGQVLDALAPGTYGSQVMRTRYLDDVVGAWARAGITQLVILGAGLDTRAYRLPVLAAATVFEVDLPELQQQKQGRLRGVRPCAEDVRFVPADLARDRLDAVLASAGFDRAVPALYVWEGVTQYLTAAAVRATLQVIGGSAAGTGVVFTYVLPSRIADGGYGGSAALQVQLGPSEPWLFGIAPERLAGLVGECGLQLVSDIGDAEYQQRYLAPIGRRLDVDPGERIALAVV